MSKIEQQLYEQKVAENTLLIANAEKMAEISRMQGKFSKAKWWERRAEELSRKRKALVERAATVVVHEEYDELGN